MATRNKQKRKRRLEPNHAAEPTSPQKYEVPVEGSLGLLALGYQGLLIWRKKIKEVESLNR